MAFTRQISLPLVAGFGGNLRDALDRASIRAADRAAVCESHVTARCALCGAEVSGGALVGVLLGTGTAEAMQSDRLSRLRLGYCVNPGCNSAYYEFTFEPHDAVDWAGIPTEKKERAPSNAPGGGIAITLAESASNAIQRHLNWRTATILALLLAAWIARQWVTGGTIPIIREGKTYTSDVPPASDTMPDDEPP